MDPVVHFEMPYDDAERIGRFYESAFGWKTNAMSDDIDRYVLASTAQADGAGAAQPGAIDGGFYRRNPQWPAQHPSVVIAVQDIGAAMLRVAAAGGTVLGEPMDIPGVGRYVCFFDTEGNRVGMLEPVAVARRAPSPGAK
jgi:predicted enzyme related to lactoylglutathione lyase